MTKYQVIQIDSKNLLISIIHEKEEHIPFIEK